MCVHTLSAVCERMNLYINIDVCVDVILAVSDPEYICIVGGCVFMCVYLEGQFAGEAVSEELHITPYNASLTTANMNRSKSAREMLQEYQEQLDKQPQYFRFFGVASSVHLESKFLCSFLLFLFSFSLKVASKILISCPNLC